VYFDPPVRSIGRYEVAGRLATGGMGEILLAQLRGPGGFERAVVIKRILPHLSGHSTAERMFLDEARIVAGIRHPNVIQVQELLHEGDNLCIVMEYLEGENLSGLMRRMLVKKRQLPPSICAHIVAELAAGLHAAHDLETPDGRPGGLVHRDVSPQNAFITYDGSVKVLDFGIAYFHDRQTRTETGTLRGKFEYMSPEQCLAKPLDRRSDVFALGIVLYELTTGRRLFRRKNQLLTLKAIVEEPFTPPSAFMEDYPDQLEEILGRALAKDTNDRYQTAAEMRRDLVHASHQVSESALPDETLAALMDELFSDRKDEKRAMLQRIRAGTDPGPVPEAEVDEHIELPTLDEVNPSVVSKDVEAIPLTPPKPTRGRRTALIAASTAAVLLAGAAAVAVMGPRPTHQPGPAASSPPPPPPAASSRVGSFSASVAPATQAPATVTFHVESVPSGATVSLGGESEGTTPLDLAVPRGDAPVEISLLLPGYHVLAEKVVPNVDQRLRLVMTRRLSPGRPAKPAPTASGYRRFD
jgi:serine/threonine protein kinase